MTIAWEGERLDSESSQWTSHSCPYANSTQILYSEVKSSRSWLVKEHAYWETSLCLVCVWGCEDKCIFLSWVVTNIRFFSQPHLAADNLDKIHDECDNNLLHVAASKGHAECLQHLTSLMGEDCLNERNIEQLTPAGLAIKVTGPFSTVTWHKGHLVSSCDGSKKCIQQDVIFQAL